MGAPEARVSLSEPRNRGWAGVAGLPGLEAAVGGVLGEQLVEDRGAGARESHDEEWLPDRDVQDLGICAQGVRDLQAIAEQHEDVAPDQQTTHQAELGLFVQRAEQRAHRRFEVVVAPEVAESGALARGGHQPRGIEAHAALQRATQGVEGTQPKRTRAGEVGQGVDVGGRLGHSGTTRPRVP